MSADDGMHRFRPRTPEELARAERNEQQRVSNQFAQQIAASQAANAQQAALQNKLRLEEMLEQMRRQREFILPLQLLNANMGLADQGRRLNSDFGPNIARQTFFSGI